MDTVESSSNKEGHKRLFGTVDPDYVSPPDSKKIKLLQAKGEEEFYGRVVKVVEKQFMTEIERKNYEIEEIDEKILKVQQCLHTLRYCISLNFYAFGKFKGKAQSGGDKNPQVNHPLIRQHLGNPVTSVESLPTSESLSDKYQKTKSKLANDNSSAPLPNSEAQKDCSKKNNFVKMTPANVQYLATHPAYEIISQGRQGRFQKKIRVVIGNTYQYVPDSEGIEDHLKFKWRIYVRGPPQDNDISSVVSSVKFTLDKSYSPHDVIIVREPPFSLSRRGWGEFKIYLELTFTDTRNKPIQMMHHLTLARTDDPLAFTGIWRLGKEMWYDIWLYTKATESETGEGKNETETAEDMEMTLKALEEKGMRSKMLYSDNEGNMTLAHSCDKEEIGVTDDAAVPSVPKSTQLVSDASPEDEKQNEQNGSTVASKKEVVNKEQKHPLVKGDSEKSLSINNSITSTLEDRSSTNLRKFTKETAKGEQKLHKILIRQADGSLVSWMVPLSMYNMALKFSGKNKSGAQVSTGKASVVTTKGSPVGVAAHNGATAKGIIVAPPANGSILSRTSLSTLQTDTKKNGLLKAINAANKIKQTLLPATKDSVHESPSTILGGTPRGTLIRFSPLLQKQVLISPPNTNAQRQGALSQGTLLQSNRPALTNVSAEGDGAAAAIRVSSASHGVLATKIAEGRGIASTATEVVGTSNPIRLSVSTLSPNNAKVIKTALLGAGDKKTTLAVSLNKASSSTPFTLKTEQPSLAIVEGGGGGSSPARSQQPKVTILNNGIRVNTSQILRSSTAPSASTNNTFKGASTLSLLPPREAASSATTSATIPTSQLYVPQGKITTRRIFISAPPHLVKLREAASAGQQKGEADTQLQSQQEAAFKAKAKGGMKQLVEEIESEVSSLQKFEERKKALRSLSSSCISVDEILRIYLKGLPLFLTEETRGLDLPFSAPSLDHFKSCFLGRRRALEFWRAREIQKELQILNPPNWRAWSAVKIVSWARRHRYTPVSSSSISALEKLCNCRRRVGKTSTLTILNESPTKSPLLAKGEKSLHQRAPDLDEPRVIVVDSLEDEENVNTNNQQKEKNAELYPFEFRRNEPPILVVTPHMAGEFHFLDLSLSKVRLKLEPEEVIPGVKMNVSKSVLWKATMCFMEDILRSTYAEAVTTDTTRDPPSSPPRDGPDAERESGDEFEPEMKVKAKHVLAALSNGRPQFQLFSQFGLGKEAPHPQVFDNPCPAPSL